MPSDPGLSAALQPGQHAGAVARPLPRRTLGRGVVLLLLLLRLYVVFALPLVAYAFVRAIRASGHPG